MIETFYLTKNDLQPYYKVSLTDSGGVPIDLTGATIKCSMKNLASGVLKINQQTTGVAVTSAATGEFEYRWQTADVDAAATYAIEFEITPATGGKFTIPNPGDGRAIVVIMESLDAS